MPIFRTIRTAVALALVFGSAAASASPVSGTYTVVGSNFVGSSTPPFASITESFSITFDNALTVSQQTSGIVLNASTITPTSTLAYTYVPVTDILIVGGIAATVASSDPTSIDFALVINNASKPGGFGINSLSYSYGTNAVYTALTTSRGAPQAVTVPEPSGLALVLVAVPAMVFARRRNRPSLDDATAAG